MKRLAWSRLPLYALVTAVLIGLSGCNKTPAGPDVNLTVIDLTVGTGAIVADGSLVTVNFTGWFYDATKLDDKGTQFETTTGGAPLQFYVGLMQVISGWDLGLPGMQVGGVRRLIVPPELAYGSVGNGVVPPNQMLVFDITLLASQ